MVPSRTNQTPGAIMEPEPGRPIVVDGRAGRARAIAVAMHARAAGHAPLARVRIRGVRHGQGVAASIDIGF